MANFTPAHSENRGRLRTGSGLSRLAKQLDVHLILDNDGTHKTVLIRRWLAKRTRFHVHFTPTSASWINLVERWFATLTEKQIRRGVHRNLGQLEAAFKQYLSIVNASPKPFVWTKTADEILASVARFCARTSEDRTLVASRAVITLIVIS
jgi:hypothetical protein